MGHEEKYKVILDNLPVLICHFLPSSEIIYVNKAYCSYFNKRKHELVGESFLTLILEEDKDIVWSNIISLNIDNKTIVHEHRVIKDDNSLSWHKWTNKAFFNEAGEIISYLSIGEDITARKKAEAEVSKLSLAVKQSSATIIITDSDGCIEYANPVFKKTTDYTVEEAIGKNPSMLKSGFTTEKEYKELWKTITSGNTWQGEFLNVKKNKEKYWEKAIISPVIDDNGKILNFVAVKEDITEKKAAEQALKESNEKLQEINKTKDKFFSIISHDLRSPFNAILGFSQILLEEYDKCDAEELGRIVKIVNNSANLAFDLLENLLTWSLSQTDGIKYAPEKLDLRKLLSETISGLQVQAGKKNIKILDKIPENELIFADKNMITLILRNLFSNAIKFTNKDGKVTISSKKQKPGKFLKISISDTGVGIPKDEIDNLFHIDKKNSKEGTAKEKGTGLGLILCKEFIEKHDGMIWVESELWKGSIFSFTIPLSK